MIAPRRSYLLLIFVSLDRHVFPGCPDDALNEGTILLYVKAEASPWTTSLGISNGSVVGSLDIFQFLDYSECRQELLVRSEPIRCHKTEYAVVVDNTQIALS